MAQRLLSVAWLFVHLTLDQARTTNPVSLRKKMLAKNRANCQDAGLAC